MTKEKLIILDLDETLIHATTNKLEMSEDFTFEKYFVYTRPFLTEFLHQLSLDFKVGIWSSADDEYVESIIKTIAPSELSFELVWGRSRCSYRRDIELGEFIYEKRLDKLKKRGFRLEQILVVDDTHEKSRTNYGNAIYIKEFNGDKRDDELYHLLAYLRTLKECENVRRIEKRGWRQKVST